jgi:sugar transferase (PEP-CTERM/EpsH1 system associated)
MKILWVKAGGLVPPDFGGRIRSYHILRELARTHEVTLFTFYAEQPHDPHPHLNEIFKRVECRPLRLPALGSIGVAPLYARCFFSLHPYTIAKFCKPQVARDLRHLVRSEKYDVIVCDFAVAGGVIPWQFPCPKVLFTHNVEAQIWKRHVQVARNPIWKLVCFREYLTMSRAERSYLKLADHVLTVSEADREFFAKLIDPEKITVIPTGVDLTYFRPASGRENPRILVFTGAMDWLANIDAVVYFAEQVLPLIRLQIPEVTLSVVGRLPSPRIRELAQKISGVRVTGRVEDVRPYISEAAVYIVPLRVGGGTRLKIFEAMAMGKAIVSTSVGAEGLGLEDGVDIRLADNPETFADAVVDLLRNEEMRRKLGQAAAQRVRDYDWSTIAERFGQVLSGLIESGKRQSSPVTV